MDWKLVESMLHVDLIKEELRSYLSSPYGKEFVDALHFMTDEKLIRSRLKVIADLKSLLERGSYFPVFQGQDLRPALERLSDPLYYWDGETFLQCIAHLDFLYEFKQLIQKNNITSVFSSKDFQLVPFFLKQQIVGMIDEYGQVRSNASPALQQIRRQKAELQLAIEKRLYDILKIWKDKGIVETSVQPTLRNGRMVIPVLSHKKALVRGVVADISATGQTLFIEPQQIFQLNNQLQSLEGEERKEIIRLLTTLTNLIRSEKAALEHTITLIGNLDFLTAAATMAYHQKAVYPEIVHEQKLVLKQARHPILEKYLTQKGRLLVPLNLAMKGTYRAIVISGPNAGGKSVVLKTVGLLQYMLQCGLLVPCDEQSSFPLFAKILVNIGDHQSMSDDLSTYTWKLSIMKSMYEEADEFSLVIIDEIEAGTEPEIGAVISEAYLDNMVEKNVFLLVATHHQRLKNWASSHPKAVNASMLFDNEKLEPTYELFIGLPGQSYAMEIAQKIHFPEKILQDAKNKLSLSEQESNDLLQQLVHMHRELLERQKKLEVAEDMVTSLIKEYEELNAKLQEKKQLIIKNAEREAQKMLNDARKLIENTIREIRENALNKEKTKQIRKTFEEKKEKLMERPQPELLREPLRPLKVQEQQVLQIQPGDQVRIKETHNIGEVLEVKNDMVRVEVNGMILTLSVDDIEKVNREKINKKTGIGLLSDQAHVTAVVDVRGMRVEEALQEIDKKIDLALLHGLPFLQIIHGKGYGILKNAIREYLEQYKDILEFTCAKDAHEDGFTMVRFLE